MVCSKGGYILAHLMKANRNQVGGLTRHFERYKKENGVLHNANCDKLDKIAITIDITRIE